jgi:hypothetical protein
MNESLRENLRFLFSNKERIILDFNEEKSQLNLPVDHLFRASHKLRARKDFIPAPAQSGKSGAEQN